MLRKLMLRQKNDFLKKKTCKSPKTNTTDGLDKKTSSMSDEIALKTVHKDEEVDRWRKIK